MGTTKSGRYLNTKGSGRSVSDFALVHSNEGDFGRKQIRINGKPAIELRACLKSCKIFQKVI